MFEIRTDESGTVFLAGRLDASQTALADERLESLSGTARMDLSELDYISSAGIGVILKTYKRLHDAGGALSLVNLPARILNVFQYAGLDRILDIR
jgi:anti-sigma B factor antagonist